MPLQTIGEDTTLDSLDNSETQPLGHSTAAYGVPTNDTTSIFSHSTNSTASNLPGPGRVLGNFYSLTGRRLERTLGDLAHRAGFGPEAIYQQINKLCRRDWITDGKKASTLQKLCLKLFEYANSVVDSTRYTAIMRWGDILRHRHELYVWLFLNQQTQTINQANGIIRMIEAFRSTNDSLTKSEDDVLTRTSLLIDCHSVGLNVINFNRTRLLIEGGNIQVDWTGVTVIRREEIEKWGVSFKYLLESLSDPTISKSSRWYIDFWSSRLVRGNIHLQIALQSCRTLQCVLDSEDSEAVEPTVHFYRWNVLAILGKRIHENFVERIHSRVMLAQCDDSLPCDGGPVHIATILNELVRSYNRVYSSGLDIVPDPTCITMLGSTDLISADDKEKIRGFLKGLQNDDEDKGKAFTKLMLLRSCNKLLRRTMSELNDTECFDTLSNATSFTDGAGRWAILQLGDILQSLPEVYMLLITLGGDEMRDCVQTLRQSLDVSDDSTSAPEHYPRILINLRSLLACHAAGLWLASEDMLSGWDYKANEFIAQTAPFDNENFREAHRLFVPYLMDNMTFNPFIFYLKYCISWIRRAECLWIYKHPLLSCSIVQDALLKKRSVPHENRNAMEELGRSMQNSIIEQLRSSSIESNNIDLYVKQVGRAMWSVYTDLTESKQAFVDEAEVYLSQLCKLLFDMIVKAKHNSLKRRAIEELLKLFENRNVFGWFLSIRGPDAEQSISRFLEDTDGSQVFDPESVKYYEWPFSHLEVHKLGVELLVPRREKLHFEGADLTKHLSTRSSEPPLTPEQKERWINAFKTLAANLRSSDSYLMDISLFYFANCPLPFETDPVLDTAIALDYCANLQRLISETVWFDEKGPLSRAVYHIHSCLTKRVEFVQWFCTDQAPEEPIAFCGTPFDIPKVVEVLNDLAKLSKEKLGSDAPELLPVPDY